MIEFNEIEFRARMSAVEAQRNRALADHAIAVGALAVASSKIERLSVTVKELTARVAELSPKEE